MADFDLALAFTLKEEGGFVDNPVDHGGATNCGITQNTYDFYRHTANLPFQSVRLITPAEANIIYYSQYWTPAQCLAMACPLDIVHFDWCVQHSVHGATESLQMCLGVSADGDIGPVTLAAISAVDVNTFVPKYLQYRRNWYNADVARDPTQQEFLTDWLGRVDRLEAYVQQWLTP